MSANTEYTAEGFDQEIIDGRIAAVMERRGWTEQPDNDDPLRPDWQRDYQHAFELAASFPASIALDLFLEIMARRGEV